MEMLDVLNRLKEINESTPGLVDDAIDNVTRTNPKQTEAIVSEDSEDYSKMTDEKLIQTYNAVMANAYAGDAGAIEDEMEKRNLEENKKPIEEAKPDFLDMDKDGDKKEPMKKAIKDKEVVKEEDAYDNERFIIIGGKAKIDGGNTPDKKDHVYAPDAKTALQLHKQGKKVYKEAIQMSADTPQEASMLMQILKLAGIDPQPVDDQTINQHSDCGCDDCPCDGNCGADCTCADCNKTEETYANEPDTKVQDTDTLVNFHSGGLNRQKGTHPKVAGGDNPMQKATENMTDSLRKQYAEFKANYLNAVNEQKKDR